MSAAVPGWCHCTAICTCAVRLSVASGHGAQCSIALLRRSLATWLARANAFQFKLVSAHIRGSVKEKMNSVAGLALFLQYVHEIMDSEFFGNKFCALSFTDSGFLDQILGHRGNH
jgi:hypothetical protein